jgi:hypothetical protein
VRVRWSFCNSDPPVRACKRHQSNRLRTEWVRCQKRLVRWLGCLIQLFSGFGVQYIFFKTHPSELANGTNLTDYERNGFDVKKDWLGGLGVSFNFLVALVSNTWFLCQRLTRGRGVSLFTELPTVGWSTWSAAEAWWQSRATT